MAAAASSRLRSNAPTHGGGIPAAGFRPSDCRWLLISHQSLNSLRQYTDKTLIYLEVIFFCVCVRVGFFKYLRFKLQKVEKSDPLTRTLVHSL